MDKSKLKRTETKKKETVAGTVLGKAGKRPAGKPSQPKPSKPAQPRLTGDPLKDAIAKRWARSQQNAAAGVSPANNEPSRPKPKPKQNNSNRFGGNNVKKPSTSKPKAGSRNNAQIERIKKMLDQNPQSWQLQAIE